MMGSRRMWAVRFRFLAGLILACGVAGSAGCGGGKSPASTGDNEELKSDIKKLTAAVDRLDAQVKKNAKQIAASSTPAGKGGTKPPANVGVAKTPEAQVTAALDTMISAIEKQDVRTLLEDFMPVETLSEMRREGGIDLAVLQMQRQLNRKPDMLKELLTALKNARKTKPTFNRSKTMVTFRVVLSPDRVLKPGDVPLLADIGGDPKVDGYGSDLAAALKKATTDLEAGKVQDYLEAMLPILELQLNDVEELAKRLKASKTVTVAMIADFKKLQTAKPKLEDGGNTAVFTFEGPKFDAKKKPLRTVPQVFKFQKAAGNWRLFDNTTAMRKTTKDFARKMKAVTRDFKLEKFGNQWRMASERRSRDRRYEKTRAYRDEKTDSKTAPYRGEKTKTSESPRGPKDAPPDIKEPPGSELPPGLPKSPPDSKPPTSPEKKKR